MCLRRFWVRIQKNLTGKRPLGRTVKCPCKGDFKTKWGCMCHLLASWSPWGTFVKKSKLNACFLIFASFQNNYHTSTILLPWNIIHTRKAGLMLCLILIITSFQKNELVPSNSLKVTSDVSFFLIFSSISKHSRILPLQISSYQIFSGEQVFIQREVGLNVHLWNIF